MSSDRREPSEKTLTVVDIPGCGLGLQAVRTLESGTVVLQEAPIAILRATSLHKAFAPMVNCGAILYSLLLPKDARRMRMSSGGQLLPVRLSRS
jgi:hypothetical protein